MLSSSYAAQNLLLLVFIKAVHDINSSDKMVKQGIPISKSNIETKIANSTV